MFFKKNNERSIPPPPKGRGFLDRGLMNKCSKSYPYQQCKTIPIF